MAQPMIWRGTPGFEDPTSKLTALSTSYGYGLDCDLEQIVAQLWPFERVTSSKVIS
jgi:hypothetical protein